MPHGKLNPDEDGRQAGRGIACTKLEGLLLNLVAINSYLAKAYLPNKQKHTSTLFPGRYQQASFNKEKDC